MRLILALIFVMGLALQAEARTEKPVASITIHVEDVSVAVEKISERADKAGAAPVSRNVRTGSSYNNATLQFNVSQKNTENFLNFVRGLGDVSAESSNYKNESSKNTNLISITVNDKDNYQGKGRRANLFAGASVTSARVNGIGEKELSFTGAGLTVALRRRSAQLTILTLKLDKEFYEEDASDSEEEVERKVELKKENSGSMALISHSTYSSYLGDGNRAFLNPFAGVAYGYGHVVGESFFTIGGQVGLELINISGVVLGISASQIGLYNTKEGATSSQYDAHIFIPF